MRLVARVAGCSVETVSKCLDPRKRHLVTAEMRAKVHVAAEQVGFKLEGSAKRRKARQGYAFGLLTSVEKHIVQSGYHMGILGGMLDRVLRTGHKLDIFRLQDHSRKDLDRLLFERGIDGILIITWRMHPEMIEFVEKTPADFPLVVINDFYPELKANVLYTDVREGMRKAVAYLVSKDYKEIGYLARPGGADFEIEGRKKASRKKVHIPSIDAEEKMRGFLEGLKEHDLPVKKTWIRECPSFKEEDIYKTMKGWVREENLPRALCCGNDDIALAAIKALKEKEKWSPEEIALIGFDGIDQGRLISPSLTTVKQPLYQMGQEAIDILIDKIEFQDPKPVQRRYEPEILARQTS